MGKSYQKQWTGVFGDPVDDNPTVVMEQAAFDAAGIPMEYLTIQVKKGDLEAAVQGMRAMNFTGINITMPHKGEVLQYLDEISESARIMGAVNTVYWKNGKLAGENTDGKGFLKSIQDGEVPIKGKKAVILGAGGAARAIAVELADAGIKTVTVINKIKLAGQALAKYRAQKPMQREFLFHGRTVSIFRKIQIFSSMLHLWDLQMIKSQILFMKI